MALAECTEPVRVFRSFREIRTGSLYEWAGIVWSESVVSSPSDSVGHIFIDYDPGRYNGVIILEPTSDGFEDFDTLGEKDNYLKRFYFAETVDTDGDGQFEVLQYSDDCEPSCAEGLFTGVIMEWNGIDYVPRDPSGADSAEPIGVSTPLATDGIGGIHVGMTLGEIARATGRNFQSNYYEYLDVSEGYCYFAWIPDLDGMHLIMDGAGPDSSPSAGSVGAIFIRDRAFTTDTGIRVGDSEASLLKRLGERLTPTQHEYIETGTYYDMTTTGASPEPLVMRFTVEDGTVVEIIAGFESSATLVEGCL